MFVSEAFDSPWLLFHEDSRIQHFFTKDVNGYRINEDALNPNGTRADREV